MQYTRRNHRSVSAANRTRSRVLQITHVIIIITTYLVNLPTDVFAVRPLPYIILYRKTCMNRPVQISDTRAYRGTRTVVGRTPARHRSGPRAPSRPVRTWP